MKKFLILLISFFMFISFTKADYISCNLQKGVNNNTEYSKGDTIEVNVITDFYSEDGILDKADIQIYYNPYVFELLPAYNDENVYIEDGYKITNFNTYSSIIDFSIQNITGKNMYVNGGNILISKLKFKVKDSAPNGRASIELIGDNSEFYVKSSEEEFPCNNSKLYYNIVGNAKINIDSTLSGMSLYTDKEIFIDIKPNVTTYSIDTHQESISFYPYCSSSECETTFNPTNAEVNYKLKEGKNVIQIINDVDGAKTTYTLNINYAKKTEDVQYKFPSLKKLTVENFKFLEEFKEDVYTYHLVVPSTVDSLLIDYDADNDVNVEIIGNENFVTGENIVRIKTNNDYDEGNYYIVVTKTEKEEDSKLPVIDEPTDDDIKETKNTNNKYILIGVFSILIVVSYILYDIYNNKKKSQEENNDEIKNDTEENNTNESNNNEE